MTRRIRWVPRAVLAVSAAALAAGAPAAAFATAPGDNGTVKIHAAGTPVDDHRNQPHVCVFYLDAFGFDTAQSVSWHIDQHAPTGHDANVETGTITLADGTGHTDDLRLPDGHYKLYWNFAGEHGKAKHKVFWVDCAGASPSPSTPGGGSSPSTGSSPSVAPSSNGPAPSGSPSASQPAGGVGAGSPSVSPSQAGSSLPVTGAPLGVLAGVAAAMIAAGILLRTRITRLFHRH
ncbi:hypothetical protein Athai_36750 [Actinocatenispora thailandica]|uniref:Gram-positive cocci surface proteins LPxTG domain-containing protein n=1 Tax=Actinocatenispora thailandica TaxID=227318 RepID=A0A7R7HXH2_9ACTN|nr:hypothetical protein [Actinocatenispora thailandica]BCJ36172.1 hypothetical protein Athai_36750 [Actinocatenispora thailandica]